MTDYKNIHETIKQRDYHYSEGWRQERDGIWLLIGMALIGVCVVIGRLV
jgi:hypothetical protein